MDKKDTQKFADLGGIKLIDIDKKEKIFKFVLPSFEEMPKELYSNHVIVNHSPNEFNLFFTRVNPPISETQLPKTDRMILEVVARITLPPPLIEGLIKALGENLKNFEEEKL